MEAEVKEEFKFGGPEADIAKFRQELERAEIAKARLEAEVNKLRVELRQLNETIIRRDAEAEILMEVVEKLADRLGER